MVVDCGCRASRRRENIVVASERENFWSELAEPTNEFSKFRQPISVGSHDMGVLRQKADI